MSTPGTSAPRPRWCRSSRRRARSTQPGSRLRRSARARSQRAAERLARECDDLETACRRFETEHRAGTAALAQTWQGATLITGAQADSAELARLQAWSASIAARSARIGTDGQQAGRDAAAAARDAVAVFDSAATLTAAARSAAASRRHDALVAAGALPEEDGSTGSRVTGFFDALRDDVTGPVDVALGLVGAHGDLGGHWSALGRGLRHAATHPLDLLGTAVDLQDLRQEDFGHWLGTLGPGVLFGLASGGTYDVAVATRSADLLARTEAFAEELRLLRAAADLEETTAFQRLLGDRTSSSLVPGGGRAVD